MLLSKFVKATKAYLKEDFFNPHRSFFQLLVVWVATAAVLAVAGFLAYGVLKTSNLSLSLSAEGYDLFLTKFKLPLWVAALLAPILTVFAVNHRSEQSKEAMRLTGVQNNFANYYKHIEEFEKYVEKVVTLNPILFSGCAVHARQVYSVLYPKNHLSVQSINTEVVDLLVTSMDRVVSIFIQEGKSEIFPVSALFEISEVQESIGNVFKRSVRQKEVAEPDEDDEDFHVEIASSIIYKGVARHYFGHSVVNLLREIKNEFEQYEMLLRFDMTYNLEPFRAARDKLDCWDRLWELQVAPQLAYRNILEDSQKSTHT